VRRLPVILALLVLMAGFGFGVNRFIASKQTAIGTGQGAAKPTETHPQFTLPGTIYVAQGGALFALHGTNFTQLRGPEGWMQPSLLPDGSGLLAVKQVAHYYSDLYLLGTDGSIKQQISHNGVSTPNGGDLSGNHWAFYPRVGADGRLYFSYDSPKSGFQVDLAVWSSPLSGFGNKQQMQRFTTPNQYTGGDVDAVPLTGGGIIYAGYGYGTDGKAFAQLFYQSTPRDKGTALTTPTENCFSPALSAQGSLAFVCSPSSTESDIQVATFDAIKHQLLGRHPVVSGTLAASPSWSPDGTTLLYYAPASSGSGYFELWWLDRATTATPVAPRELTTVLDLDATSPAVWSNR
jgi:Tol biopolymer transport system component